MPDRCDQGWDTPYSPGRLGGWCPWLRCHLTEGCGYGKWFCWKLRIPRVIPREGTTCPRPDWCPQPDPLEKTE